jgi:hypothetical protein
MVISGAGLEMQPGKIDDQQHRPRNRLSNPSLSRFIGRRQGGRQ